MKKTFKKILVITLILISTILLLPSCKDKTDEPVPEIMPYGVYYFANYDYDDVSSAPWHLKPFLNQRYEKYKIAMEHYGYYFVFTPNKIIFGGNSVIPYEYEFTYTKNSTLGVSFIGNLVLNTELSKQHFSNKLDFYYNKLDNLSYEFTLNSKGDNMKFRYVYFPNNVPPFIFDGSLGDFADIMREPINYNDFI